MSDSHMPRLAIVVCTYNALEHLEGFFGAIRAQKTEDVQLVIMDGGSSDGTVDEIRRNAEIIDHWESKPDNGVYDAMNASIGHVRAEWVLFLGADDRLMPAALPRLANVLQGMNSQNMVLYGDVYRPAGNVLYDGKFTKYKILRRNICQQAIVYPVSQLKIEGFEHRFKINADHIKNIKFFFNDQVVMRHAPICIAYFEDISQGLSRNRCDEGFISYRRQLARELGGIRPFLFCCLIDAKEALRGSLRKALGRTFSWAERS